MPSQDYTTDDSSNQCFECSRMLLFESTSWWGVIRLRRLVSLISEETTGKQMVAYNLKLIVLYCSSGRIATCPVFPKKTGDHLLGNALCVSNFCWIENWSTYTVDCCICILVNPRFITCHDVIDMFRSTVIVFFEHLFRPIETSLFLSDWQIVWDSTRRNHTILNVCWCA